MVRSTAGGSRLRAKLTDCLAVLEALRPKLGRLRREARDELVAMLQDLNVEVQRMPQLSLVRPASIALHNLAVSLDGSEQRYADLEGELEAACECIRMLLDDARFGITGSELGLRVREILGREGGDALPCGHSTWDVMIVSLATRPFPCDASRMYEDRPVALRTCSHCGAMTMHDLARLGML